MSKRINIAVAIAISSLLAVNFYLLFSDKSVIMKSVYVEQYERMTSSNYSVELSKEALVAPMDTYTVYVGNDAVVESWIVSEGDPVQVGDELAILNTEQAEGQRQLWEAEADALDEQKTEVRLTIAKLKAEQEQAKYDNSSDNQMTEDETSDKDAVNVNVHVEISPEGSFASAIVSAELELAAIERQLIVLDAQLSQDPSRPAIVSPVEGVVANVHRLGTFLAVDIYSPQKVIITYAKENEWQHIKEGDSVVLQGDGIVDVFEGTVQAVSTVPTIDGIWLEAYKKLDSVEIKNPLAYYEVRILTDGLQPVPFGNNLNAILTSKEVEDAGSVPEKWLRKQSEEMAIATIIDKSGRAVQVEVSTPFTLNTRAVVTDGLALGNIVIQEPVLREYTYSPAVFLPMPTYAPTMEEWKSFGWENYLKYMLVE